MQKGFFQPIIKLYHKNTLRSEHFILSNANQQAYLYISKWPVWYGNTCVIQGEEGTGKTCLSNIWQKKTKALKINLFDITKKDLEKNLKRGKAFILDDFQQYFSRKSLLQNLKNHDFNNIEEVLVKIFDICQHSNKNLLLVTTVPIQELNIRMEDLKSRVLSSSSFMIDIPDEVALNTYLVKSFSESQLRISAEVTQYISKHISKSYKEVDIIANEIDNFSLEQKRNVTIPLVRDVLSRRKLRAV